MRKRSVKKKLSIRKLTIFIAFMVFIICILIFRIPILYFIQSKSTGYSFNAIKSIHKYDIYKDIKSHKYSMTLDKIINTTEYNNKYYVYYLNTNYIEDNDYFTNINDLFDIGYTDNDINIIFDSLDKDNIKILIQSDYYKDIANILKLNYFNKDNLTRYLDYGNKNKTSYEDTVTFVNIGLDKDYYTDAKMIEDTSDTLMLVNKYNGLDKNYIPDDLEVINTKYSFGSNNKLRHEAREKFETMCDAALKDNIKIYNGSAFRSYSYQANLYNRYVMADGKVKADTYAARAGYSEHQTGLALDIMNASHEFLSSGDKEYDWLVNNSYKYGFILRYPKEKEKITGYMYEEWHFRYVGLDAAKNIYNSNITFDEYMARR